MRLSFLALVLGGCVGPVDGVGAVGELGHLAFSVTSDWYLEEGSLTEVGIVTGHAQNVNVDLTGPGEKRARGRADEIVFRMEPDDGVTLHQSGPMDDDIDDPPPPSLSITVEEPGTYTLLARLHDDLFDKLALRFAAPATLDLALYTRAPYAEDFEPLDAAGPSQVREGTQLAWLPIPRDADGARLAGDVATEMSADPREAVVPAGNVYHVNEEEVGEYAGVPSLYFIEEGEVTVTLADTFNAAEGARAFTVVAE